ncbi:RUS family member 1-like [Solenopsis invicta]|uniref:RUS family member 1-like n=1 Tax=Solenopsis invicta TaxID=13686 RepID=UPI000E33FEDA|nr:RUS family member 1-like [Solenopsis invicta]
MISRRVLGCAILIVLSQYVDAASRDLEPILASLKRLEETVAKTEQSSMSCLVPFNKIYNFVQEQQNQNESPETSLSHKLDSVLQSPKNQKKNRRSDNINANVNENVNANFNTNRYHRRSLIGDPRFFDANQNLNSNVNFNSNTNKNLFDYSDEE